MLAFTFNSKVTDAPRAVANLLAGEVLGMRRIETSPYGDKEYMLVQATAAITQGQSVKCDVTQSAPLLGQAVVPTAAPTDSCLGVYEGTVAAASGQAIWVCTKGVANALVGVVTAGQMLSPTTGGVLQTAPFTSGTQQDVMGVALATNASGTAFKQVRLL